MDEETPTGEYTVRCRLTNQQPRDVSFVIEPWGFDFSLAKGATVDLVMYGPADGGLEWEIGDGMIVVYGWVGSAFDAYLNGEHIAGSSFPVPGLPKGMSMSGFMGVVFGGQSQPPTDQAPNDHTEEKP